MRLYSRQKHLLSLLNAAGGNLSATDLQKLLFLHAERSESEPGYQFVPHRFGCFSFQAAADRESLLDKGCLEPVADSGWQLSAKAKPFLPTQHANALRLFVTRTIPERGKTLIARVYREYPFYAIRSEIVDTVLPDDAERKAVRDAAPSENGTGLFTIGYEGDSIDGYLNRLIRNNVHLLCDVRKNPLSRKTGFSKRQLAGYCEKVGIAYRHLPELGIPGSRRRELNSREDYDALFEEYEREDLPLAGNAIEELGRLLKEHKRIALTCFEKDHECCHRHCVAEAMERTLPDCPESMHI